jgi:hypothetical protein
MPSFREMATYQHTALSRETFEATWRTHFDRLYRDPAEGAGRSWLPNQVFRFRDEIVLYHPQPYYQRCDYFNLEQALLHLQEEEFVVVDREALGENTEQVGIVFRRHRQADELSNEGRYHIEGQPLEFYAFGRRSDWGFISSEPYNIGVLSVDETLLDPFLTACPGASGEQIRDYLDHTPNRYRSRFERAYLNSSGAE